MVSTPMVLHLRPNDGSPGDEERKILHGSSNNPIHSFIEAFNSENPISSDYCLRLR